MKKFKLIYTLILIIFITGSCVKDDENLDVDLSTYNADSYVDTELDDWIYENLTDPYNIEVVYRFDRNLADPTKDIAPVEYGQVEPVMQLMIDGFLNTYSSIAGSTFIKKLTPKQFALYGSGSYNSDGSVTLGTAEGGRSVVLYDLNAFDITNQLHVKDKMHTIHHEFAHILNQNIVIPETFEPISEGDYTADWTGDGNTAAVAKELGFISQYARSSYGEDFAEMVSLLLVEGQVWFYNYVYTISDVKMQQRLLDKEAAVKDYFQTYYDINFTELQAEIQNVLKSKYNVVDPADVTQTLKIWLLQNKVSTIQYNPSNSIYAQYGDPATIKTAYNNAQAAMKTQNPTWTTGVFQYLEFRFTDAKNFVFRIAFKTASTSSTVYYADYYFGMSINNSTGDVQFTKTTLNGSHYSSNGSYLTNAFEMYLLPYLTNRVFVADFLPTTITSSNPLYRSYGGFYAKTTTSNYIYGPIVKK